MVNLDKYYSIFIANWKLNGNSSFLKDYYENLKVNSNSCTIICSPSIYLKSLKQNNENLFLFVSEKQPDFFTSTGESFEGSAKINELGTRKTNLVLLELFRQIESFEITESPDILKDTVLLQSDEPLNMRSFESSEETANIDSNFHILDPLKEIVHFEFDQQGTKGNEFGLHLLDKVRLFEDFESTTENELNTNVLFSDPQLGLVHQFEDFESDPEDDYSDNLYFIDLNQFDFTDPRNDPNWKRK